MTPVGHIHREVLSFFIGKRLGSSASVWPDFGRSVIGL
jgi:hypothetical protein